MVYSVIKMATNDSRIGDIADIILTFSYILMLFGVSTSIKKSVDKQVREERMKSEFDFTIDDDSPTQSLIHNPKEKMQSQFKPHKINPSEESIDEGSRRVPLKDLSKKRKKDKANKMTTISTQ
jgi:hypothetical protein